jgi:hypothetical protein
MKQHLITAAIVLAALIVYDMFVKKALNISAYEEFEE